MNIFDDDHDDLKMKPQTLSGIVYDKLLDMIMSNAVGPDERINVDEIAKRFGISKTPLREALKSLEKTGLISFRPYAGYSIKTFTSKEIEEIYEIRILLESFAIDQISKIVTDDNIFSLKSIQKEIENNLHLPKVKLFKMNRTFHDYFYSISGYTKLCEMIGLLWDNLAFFRMLLIQEDDYIETMKTEHWAYIDALEKRQGDRLKHLVISNLRTHAQRVPKLVRDHYRRDS